MALSDSNDPHMDVLVDSGSGINACPKGWGDEDITYEGEKVVRSIQGATIRHYGRRRVKLKVGTGDDQRLASVGFEATDATRP
eukprot:15462608-Alexandrium_andersonii.AAC.1